MKTSLMKRACVSACSMALAVALLSACGSDSAETSTEVPVTTTAADTAMAETGMADGEVSGHDHGDELAEVTWTPIPTLRLLVVESGSGWSGTLAVADFVLTEDEVAPEPVDGEGHAHLYIDGVKDRRLYDTSFTIDSLDPGPHEISVELVGNDHKTLAVDGETVAASTTIVVEGEVAVVEAEDASSVDADHIIEVTVTDGAVDVVGGSKEVPIGLGSSVAIIVTSDVAEEVHVHGYDVFADLVPGETSVIEFDANIPGGFEVELEGRGQLLVDLVVS